MKVKTDVKAKSVLDVKSDSEPADTLTTDALASGKDRGRSDGRRDSGTRPPTEEGCACNVRGKSPSGGGMELLLVGLGIALLALRRSKAA